MFKISSRDVRPGLRLGCLIVCVDPRLRVRSSVGVLVPVPMSARKITGKGGCLAADVATALETRLWKPNLVPWPKVRVSTLPALSSSGLSKRGLFNF